MDGGARKIAPMNAPFRISHGTLECKSLAASRPFYEEFLGLECVRHGKRSMLLRKGGYWSIVCVEAGDKAHGANLWNHWGLDMKSAEDVMKAHELAVQNAEKYGLDKITPVGSRHGTYQFHFRDRDGNWWEFQYVGDEERYDRLFREGDIVPMNGASTDAE